MGRPLLRIEFFFARLVARVVFRRLSGQLLWEKELMSYQEFPSLQAPETYNLSGILKAIAIGSKFQSNR